MKTAGKWENFRKVGDVIVQANPNGGMQMQGTLAALIGAQN